MPRPLTGLLPENLWLQSAKQEVINFLSSQPAPPELRRAWLLQWALWVGVRLNARDYAKVTEGAVEVNA
ncbi:MAG: hypothetical protein DMG78_14825 [Acidobacteria bacterium]|nr:MAG: hypothetical protein DMG78_14825 [Acidobacteriota bacterium]